MGTILAILFLTIVVSLLWLCSVGNGKEGYVSGGLGGEFLPDNNCSWSGNRAVDLPYETTWRRFLDRDGPQNASYRYPYRPRPIIDTDWLGFDAYRWRTIGVGVSNDKPANEWEIQTKYVPETKMYIFRAYHPTLNNYFAIAEKLSNLPEDGMVLNPIINLNTFIPLVYRKVYRREDGSIPIMVGQGYYEGMEDLGRSETAWNKGCSGTININKNANMGNVFDCQAQGDDVPLTIGTTRGKMTRTPKETSELNQKYMVAGRGDSWSIATPKGGKDPSKYWIGNWEAFGWASPMRAASGVEMWRIYRRYDPKIKTWRNVLVRKNKNKFVKQTGTLNTGEQVMSIPDGKWYFVFTD